MIMQIRDSISYLGTDYVFGDVENEDKMPQITDYGVIPEKFSTVNAFYADFFSVI